MSPVDRRNELLTKIAISFATLKSSWEKLHARRQIGGRKCYKCGCSETSPCLELVRFENGARGGIVYRTCSWAKPDLCSACCHSGPVEMLTAQLALTMAAANGGAQRIQEGDHGWGPVLERVRALRQERDLLEAEGDHLREIIHNAGKTP